jgi:hypothetical protein
MGRLVFLFHRSQSQTVLTQGPRIGPAATVRRNFSVPIFWVFFFFPFFVPEMLYVKENK